MRRASSWLTFVIAFVCCASAFAAGGAESKGDEDRVIAPIRKRVIAPTTWVIDRPRRRSIYTQPPRAWRWPRGGWRPDDEQRVVSRMRLGPDFQSAVAFEAMIDALRALHEAGAISKDIYDGHLRALKERHRAAQQREERAAAQDPVRAYRKGRKDTLESLLKSGAISRDVYKREMAKVKAADKGARFDEFRGRMQVLTRLYHRGEIDTATFLKHHTPVWDRWYRALNILRNGDFEQVEDRKVPERLVDLKDWQEVIYGYGDLGYSQVVLDREVKHSGRRSLRFTSTRGPSLISLLSTRFMCRRDDVIKIRCWVKAKGLKRGYTGRSATINFVMPEGSHDLSPAARLHIPAGTYDWMRLEMRLHTFANIPEGKFEPCQVAVKFYGEGTLWVDDLVVVPTTRRQTELHKRPMR